MDEKTLKRKEKIKDLATRILSVGLAIVIVGGVVRLIIGDPEKITYEVQAEATQEPNRYETWEGNYTPVVKQFPEDIIHHIKERDNLIKICNMNDINPAYYLMLASYNDIENPHMIYIGDVIKVPVEEKLLETSITALNNGNPLISENYHLVKEGDRLINICENRYNGKGYLAYALAYWQQINPNELKVNQFIYLLTEEELITFYVANYEQIMQYQKQFESPIKTM